MLNDMKRLTFVFSRRRRGHPIPSWRKPPDTLIPDVRLADVQERTPPARSPQSLELRDEEPHLSRQWPIWER